MKKHILIILLMASFAFNAAAQKREARNVGSFTKVSFRFPGKLYLKQGSKNSVELEGSADILKEVQTRVDGNKLIIGKEGNWWGNWGDTEKITAYVTLTSFEGASVGGSGDIIGESVFTGSNIDLSVSGSGSLMLEVNASGEIEADVSGSGSIVLKGKCQELDSDVSGSGRVEANLAVGSKASFEVSGSGKINASGSAEEVKADISGSGKVLAADLKTKKCKVQISGSGDVEIDVAQELDANISGSGTVRYRGNPNHVNGNASGSGRVSKM